MTNDHIHDAAWATSKQSVSEEFVKSALAYIDPSNRETWIHTGMGLKSGLGEAGIDIFDSWSSSVENYDPKAVIAAWRSFKPNGGITIGTVFHYAKLGGYKFDKNLKPIKPTPLDIAMRQAKLDKAKADLDLTRAEAAKRAQVLWNFEPSHADEYPAVDEHLYLLKKRCKSHGAARVYNGPGEVGGINISGALMIPIFYEDALCSLQFISHKGEKRFLAGGRKGYALIGKLEGAKSIGICEGFATGCSIFEATGNPVIVAFDAGSLPKVARIMRDKLFATKITIFADADEVGLRYAKNAATAIGATVVPPNFEVGENDE